MFSFTYIFKGTQIHKHTQKPSLIMNEVPIYPIWFVDIYKNIIPINQLLKSPL